MKCISVFVFTPVPMFSEPEGSFTATVSRGELIVIKSIPPGLDTKK